VAITEKYFSANYFDKTLTGARADQEVLRELTSRKLPNVYRHLQSIDIDLSTISLNWFLALFFDAVPFQVSNVSIGRTLRRPQLLYGYSYKAFCARLG